MRITNKDILIGYIGTLPDSKCKELYYLLVGKEVPDVDWLEFDKVRLTTSQYNKLVWYWGKEKTTDCIKILNDWLVKKNISKNISHYYNIIGWVERAYYRSHPMNDKSIKMNNINEIDTVAKAKKYVQSIPHELRAYDTEVKFLVQRYGTGILK